MIIIYLRINNIFLNKTSLLHKQFLLTAILLGLQFQFLGAQENRGNLLKIENPLNQTIIEIDLPMSLDKWNLKKRTTLIFYTLPNGNSIEWIAQVQIQVRSKGDMTADEKTGKYRP